MCDDEVTIRNIPASVISDIERIDKAINMLGEACDKMESLTWDSAETIFDALGDARSAILYLAEKHDRLVVQLQELKA
jgi:hypothetical protein